MTIYFVQAILIIIAGTIFDVNKNKKNKRRYLLFSFFLLILVAALRSRNIGTDLAMQYSGYYESIAKYDWNQIPQFSSATTFEIGYCYFTKFLSSINPDVQFYIVVTSVIIYGVLGWFIYRNSVDVRMSTLLLILSGTYYNYMNIIRQALAVVVILIGYEVMKMVKKRLIGYLCLAGFIFLASTIHSASILCLVFIPIDLLTFKRRDIIIGLLGSAVFFVFYRQIFSFFSSRITANRVYTDYLTKENESVGHINIQSVWMFLVVFLALVIGIYFMVIVKKKKDPRRLSLQDRQLQRQDNFLLYVVMFASICRFMVFRMNIINRYSFFFMPFVLILYPRAVQMIESPSNKKIVTAVIYVVMGGYFLLMTFFYEQSFHMTVPYEFYWQ